MKGIHTVNDRITIDFSNCEDKQLAVKMKNGYTVFLDNASTPIDGFTSYVLSQWIEDDYAVWSPVPNTRARR